MKKENYIKKKVVCISGNIIVLLDMKDIFQYIFPLSL